MRLVMNSRRAASDDGSPRAVSSSTSSSRSVSSGPSSGASSDSDGSRKNPPCDASKIARRRRSNGADLSTNPLAPARIAAITYCWAL